MPSFTFHEAIAKEVNKKLEMNEEILLLGSIAPDCWRNAKKYGMENRKLSHFSTLESYDERYWIFYKKYKDELDSPFVMGYLIHLMSDYYWRKMVTDKIKIFIDGKLYYRNKDGSLYDVSNNKDSLKYENYNIHGLDSKLFAYYKLKEMKHIENIEGLNNPIEELDLTGLNDTIDYANRMLKMNRSYPTPLYDFEDVIKYFKVISDIIYDEIIY